MLLKQAVVLCVLLGLSECSHAKEVRFNRPEKAISNTDDRHLFVVNPNRIAKDDDNNRELFGIGVQPRPAPPPPPADRPTRSPTDRPTRSPTRSPTARPTDRPTRSPTRSPTARPTDSPTRDPTRSPTREEEQEPEAEPEPAPTDRPTASPTDRPTASPTSRLTAFPTFRPWFSPPPTDRPTDRPTDQPTTSPTRSPTDSPTASPTRSPSASPSAQPSASPSSAPSATPTKYPKQSSFSKGVIMTLADVTPLSEQAQLTWAQATKVHIANDIMNVIGVTDVEVDVTFASQDPPFQSGGRGMLRRKLDEVQEITFDASYVIEAPQTVNDMDSFVAGAFNSQFRRNLYLQRLQEYGGDEFHSVSDVTVYLEQPLDGLPTKPPKDPTDPETDSPADEQGDKGQEGGTSGGKGGGGGPISMGMLVGVIVACLVVVIVGLSCYVRIGRKGRKAAKEALPNVDKAFKKEEVLSEPDSTDSDSIFYNHGKKADTSNMKSEGSGYSLTSSSVGSEEEGKKQKDSKSQSFKSFSKVWWSSNKDQEETNDEKEHEKEAEAPIEDCEGSGYSLTSSSDGSEEEGTKQKGSKSRSSKKFSKAWWSGTKQPEETKDEKGNGEKAKTCNDDGEGSGYTLPSSSDGNEEKVKKQIEYKPKSLKKLSKTWRSALKTTKEEPEKEVEEETLPTSIQNVEITVEVPKGLKLGLVLETSDYDGGPTVEGIKPLSPFFGRVEEGDRLLRVDGQDVTMASPQTVSRVIAMASKNTGDGPRVFVFERPQVTK